ncbi:bis(5'-nucleosyl)-tetraphosphatase (symmetrical) YqeK [Deinococcus roseus]|nr:bis(5'-nucleosyl)-tetraphosphatase (symmetrical) YqeK [Deinococcus roseus]
MMIPPHLEVWARRVQLMVKPRRFEHVLRVAELACQMARANGFDEALAYEAGLLHDIARDVSSMDLLKLAPPECPIDAAHPLALHGRAGRALLEYWGYTNEEVLWAVEEHTTGPSPDRPISKVVYIADVSEPGRNVNHHIREMAFHDLQGALDLAIGSKVRYLQGRGIQVHPRTMQVFNSLNIS